MQSPSNLLIKMSTARQRRNALISVDEPTPDQLEERRKLETQLEALEVEYRDALSAQEERVATAPDGEGAEFRDLERRASVASHVQAAISGTPLSGAEAEFNAAAGVSGGRFPLRLLAKSRGIEHRTTTDANAQQTQQTWLHRVFARSAAMHLGIDMRAVPDGQVAYPVTTAGGEPQNLARGEAAPDANFTIGVTSLSPVRASVRAVATIEDLSRLPGLEAALSAEISASLVERIDRNVFVGDARGTGDSSTVTGLQTASGVIEQTLTQAAKVKPLSVLGALLHFRDGVYASDLSANSFRVVSTVAAQNLADSTFANSAADSITVGKFLMDNGIMPRVRGKIEDSATTNGKYGYFIGRGPMGTGCVLPVWSSGQLIRDQVTGAKSGEVALTLHYLYNIGYPRAEQFGRIKYVS